MIIHPKLDSLFIKKNKMEQKDFFLKEIEKIGLVLRAILNNFLGKSENLSTTIKSGLEVTNEQLFDEIGFDLKQFLMKDELTSKKYIASFKGINSINLELLADIIFQMSINKQTTDKGIFLKKALFLYELCNKTDKTFSFERENKIKIIKNAL